MSANQSITNALTIDVEDYYMVSAFSDIVKFEDWERHESRVKKNTYRILELMEENNVKATFFVLGWVGEKYPGLVKDIHSSGHEVACHGYNHRLIYDLSPEEFRDDTRRAKGILEDNIGVPVNGYRATSYSIVKETLWALDILIEEGFLYDSSIFPIHHDRYGIPDAERFQHTIKRDNGSILEFPPTTYNFIKINFPVAGGGYLRLLPAWIIKSAVKRINKAEMKPVVMYLHPWEIDTGQPRLNGRFISRFRHYNNLHSTMPKLNALMKEFAFKPLSGFLA
jgi:polysaccharide deacetylase family protein (PEP-CTERM system associated)